ncbi:hypothetical protein BDW66DRAFT_86793 [Aspergillus desertorum]
MTIIATPTPCSRVLTVIPVSIAADAVGGRAAVPSSLPSLDVLSSIRAPQALDQAAGTVGQGHHTDEASYGSKADAANDRRSSLKFSATESSAVAQKAALDSTFCFVPNPVSPATSRTSSLSYRNNLSLAITCNYL